MKTETDFKLRPVCLVLEPPPGVRRDYALEAALRRCIHEKMNVTLKLSGATIRINYVDLINFYTPDDMDMQGLT